jgi:hypothetical protein
MDFSVCAQCGVGIENKGIHFRNHVFCSDDCCEKYEAEFADKVEPVLDELLDDGLVAGEIDDDDLGYREDNLDDSLDDDEFNFKLEES